MGEKCVVMMFSMLLFIAVTTVVNAKFLRICDGKYKIIHCFHGKIKIESALYGRSGDANACPSTDKKSMTGCQQQDITGKLRKRCDNHEGCFVRASTVFLQVTDTCGNTNNYLDIQYYCETGITEEVRICHGKYETIHCFSGTIKIESAHYGRREKNVCPSDDNKSLNTCPQQDITGHLRRHCDDHSGCFTKALPDFLGITEICKSSNNYLDIHYHCVHEVRQCDGKANEVFKCDPGYVIKVLDAYWGRKSLHICSTSKSTQKDCSTWDTLPRVGIMCDGRRSCTITGERFGNPCSGPEYFEGRYTCVKEGTTPKPTNTKYLCDRMSTLLRCFNGVLNIVDATFGRQNTNTCNKNGVGSTLNTYCARSVTKHIKFDCQNNPLCVIYASAGRYGDPCPGTSKYLKINYNCQPKGTYQPPTHPNIPSVPNAGTLPPITSAVNSATTTSQQACGISTVQQSRVINGVDAQPGAWPWQMALYSSSDDFMCGGTLLNPFWIVTAAHCVNRDPNPSSYYIVLGDTDRSKIEGYERRHEIVNIIVHTDYDKDYVIKHDSDIAMIKLQRPALFNSYISPACLPVVHPLPSTNCFITGWGKIVYPGYSHTMLQQANIKIVSREECKNKLKTAPGTPGDVITTNMLCANGNNGKSGCQGDSGGPFVCQDTTGKWVLRGIVSWGSPRCNTGDMYSVFVDVSKFVKWIHNVIRYI